MGLLQELQVGFTEIIDEMRELYLSDRKPWVVLWSTGKDSTLTLTLVWEMLQSLPAELRTKKIHIVTSDTKIEEPRFAQFVLRCVEQVRVAIKEQGLPIEMHFTEPSIKDSFWLQVLGKGNCPPTESSKFRWCTSKLKTQPVDRIVFEIIEQTPTSDVLTGDAFDVLMVLGVRNEESENRRRSIEKFATEDKFARHAKYENIKVYHPIKYVTVDDLWGYLLNRPGKLPFGVDPHDLFNIYAEFGKECPMTDQDGKQHESCGGGRQGCVVCLKVGKKDQMLISLIERGDESLIPILQFKSMMYDMRMDVRYREPLRRINEMRIVPKETEIEQTSIFESEYVMFDRADSWRYEPGPITLEGRRILLQKLLYVEQVSGHRYIQPQELMAILKAWKADGYTATEADLQPINHQADGAVLFKKDGTLNEKTSTNQFPVFRVKRVFTAGAGELVANLKSLAIRTGNHFFYSLQCFDPHRDVNMSLEAPVVNVAEFIVCQRRVKTQSDAERTIAQWLQKADIEALTIDGYKKVLYDYTGGYMEVLEAVDSLAETHLHEAQAVLA